MDFTHGRPSEVHQHRDVEIPNPRSRELLSDIRVDALDYMRSAVAQAEDGRWEDAQTSVECAQDRLMFADQIQIELDLYK